MEKNSATSQNAREYKRLRAVELYRKGMKAIRIAEVLDVTRGAVSQWLKRYREQGIEALYDRRKPGKLCRLAPEQIDELKSMLKEGAEKFGYPDNAWTGARVRDLIESRFGIKYGTRHVEKLLKKWGWTQQKPATRASRHDNKDAADLGGHRR